MNPVTDKFRAVLGKHRWLLWLAAPVAAVAVIGSVVGAGSVPPVINLAAEPLYARGARAKPTLTLALSVEFPTVGAQYVDVPNTSTDSSYTPTKEYIGYFDTASCYGYVDTPGEARPTGIPVADYKRFDRIGAADVDEKGDSKRICVAVDGFSGNFMNWAGSSAIDILRLSLSGGDRVVDTSITDGTTSSGFTVLQRAYLRTSFFNSNNFPAKGVSNAVAQQALPADLLKTVNGIAYIGNVWVASCRDRLHFGTMKEGSCDSPGNNADLGMKATAGVPVNGRYTGDAPSKPGFSSTAVANQNGSFMTTSEQQIAYGAFTSWSIKTLPAGTIACNNTTFGDPLPFISKKCYVRTPMAPDTGVASDIYLFARVRVCESNASGLLDPRKGLCQQYASGAYKPVGNLQKYSDAIRVAAFGYLNDSAGNPNQRYGGVLRAPMKYVGPKRFNENFSLMSGTNPVQEWNNTTGELIVNPEGATEGRSGVINYLNQFGRTGTPGVYKSYDPVGELYYEALRYLQGLPPTPDATAGMTTAMKDGFPVYTTWDDPHPIVGGMGDYSCVRNSIVAIGDVNTHNDKQIPGNTRTSGTNDKARAANLAANEPDFVEWTKVVGSFEAGPATYDYFDGEGRLQTTSNFNPLNTALSGSPGSANRMEIKNIGSDQAAYYMAGMAYWANTHDIRGADWTNEPTKQRPKMRVSTYVLDVNEFGQQTNLSTHKNNQFFLASKYGGFRDTTGTGNPFKVLAPGGTATLPATANSNDNWQSATVPGKAKNYFLSSSAQGVMDALAQIFENVAKEANSIAGGAISTQRLSSVENYIYQAQFDPADWSGDVVAYPVSANASGVVTVGGTTSAAWSSVAELLGKRTPSGRKIFVGPSSSTGSASEFLWSSAPTYVKDALKTPLGAATPTDTDTVGEQRLEYLRGDRTLETSPGTFRRRGKVMGDIVNSGIAYSGTLSTRFQSSSYGPFYSAFKDRRKALFVGANDGMLHAFDVTSGEELFSYIPSWVVPKLSALTSPAYVHQSYVDGSPVVAEAKVGDAWKTVLVSGTGGGGQGVFALDVSNPDPDPLGGATRFGADKVLWEFTDKNDPDMGNVIGRPQILSFRTTAAGAPKHFAVVASGVNSYAVDGSESTSGAAALFLLDLSKPVGQAWSLNTNYRKIVFPLPLTTIANGMINFNSRLDDQGNVEFLYAGDLQGNLWKLDFKRPTPAPTPEAADYWTIDSLSAYRVGTSPVPMYIAQDAAAVRQPISMEPTLLYGANRSVIVTFGTGKFLEVSDSTTASYAAQSVYAILDDGTTIVDAGSGAAISGRVKLRQGTIAAGTVTVPAFVWGRPGSTETGVRAGWYFDLPDSTTRGERQVSGFANSGGKIIFGTVIPAVNSCDDGSGNLYTVEVGTGNGKSQVSTVGIFGEPLLVQVGDPTLALSDSTGRRLQRTRKQLIVQGSSGIAAMSSRGVVAANEPSGAVESSWVGRLSWRELSNYQELRRAP